MEGLSDLDTFDLATWYEHELTNLQENQPEAIKNAREWTQLYAQKK